MPVEFIAVQCTLCNQFQSQQVRKDGRFGCRICGQWQTLQRIVARSGSARAIRVIVQTRNRQRGEQSERDGTALNALSRSSHDTENELEAVEIAQHEQVTDTQILEAIQENMETEPSLMMQEPDQWDEMLIRAVREIQKR